MDEYDLTPAGAHELASLVTPLRRLVRHCFSGPPRNRDEERFAGIVYGWQVPGAGGPACRPCG
ncbi:hypothetical protein ACWEIJ_44115 [Lentzea sp. NPDC004789]